MICQLRVSLSACPLLSVLAKSVKPPIRQKIPKLLFGVHAFDIAAHRVQHSIKNFAGTQAAIFHGPMASQRP
jgi:hypothetical protein